MSKVIKSLFTTVGIFTFSLILPIVPMPLLAQASNTSVPPSDFEEAPPSKTPPQTSMTPCIDGETCQHDNPEPPKPVVSTTVSCEGGLTTIVSKGEKGGPDYQMAVLISWKTTEFGGNYTPQQRCNVVSNRFQAAVQANAGSMKGLLLTNGPVNNRMVICALRPGETECSADNMLFTLKKENENNAGAILGRLLNTSVTGSGSTIEEGSGQQVKVDMGAWASRNLRRVGATNTNKTVPSNRPVNTGF